MVQIWRSLVPPGRFLTRTDPDMGDDSLWHDIGDKKARQKCSQSLRERTPDVIPFVQQLQQKQKEEEEKRKMEHEQQINSSGGVVEVVSSNTAAAASCGQEVSVATDYEKPAPLVMGLTSIPETPMSSSNVVAASSQQAPTVLGYHLGRDEHDDNDRAISPDTYLEEVDDFLDNAPEGDRDTFSVTDHSMAFSTHSWIRSVQSVESGAMMSLGESIREEDGTNPPMADAGAAANNMNNNGYNPPQPLVPNAIRPAMPNRFQNATRSQKMNMVAAGANFSMLSDLTDRSAQQRSMRSSKMNEASKLTSNFSVRSETTDISAAMRALVADPPSVRHQQSLRSAFQMNESTGDFSKLSMMSGLTDLSEGLNNMDLHKS